MKMSTPICLDSGLYVVIAHSGDKGGIHGKLDVTNNCPGWIICKWLMEKNFGFFILLFDLKIVIKYLACLVSEILLSVMIAESFLGSPNTELNRFKASS
jgi:hypothetical protein